MNAESFAETRARANQAQGIEALSRRLMPSVSKSQQRLMQAAEHGADFPMARKVRASMTHEQMHDFAVGSEKGKPEHVKAAPKGKPMGQSHATHGFRTHSRTKS